jgi:hypothetical protein
MSTNNVILQESDVKIIQTFIDTMVGIPRYSYPARQNSAPKPKGDFAHIRLLEEYPVGIPNTKVHTQDENTTTHRIYSPTRLRFRIGVVDTNGLAAAKIMHGWTTEAMKALMIASKVGYIKCDPLSNESAKLENEWETRQGFSLEVYKTRVFEEVVNNITSVSISSEFISGDSTYLLDFDINNI